MKTDSKIKSEPQVRCDDLLAAVRALCEKMRLIHDDWLARLVGKFCAWIDQRAYAQGVRDGIDIKEKIKERMSDDLVKVGGAAYARATAAGRETVTLQDFLDAANDIFPNVIFTNPPTKIMTTPNADQSTRP